MAVNIVGGSQNSLDQPLLVSSATIKDNYTGKTYTFPFNVNSLNWSYQVNSQSYDTIGGRVTQILSVRINTMQVQGDAGSRGTLMELYEIFKTVQDSQNQSKKPMTFSIPSRNLSFMVFLQNFQMGWDITTVTYPYYLTFEVQQDLTKVVTQSATLKALNSYSATAGGIGFNELWTGLSTISQGAKTANILKALEDSNASQLFTTGS